MQDLIIDNEFKKLMQPLSKEEYSQLEENILRDGIQETLKVWQGILIDGHNRYEIAQKYGLNFEVSTMQFENRNARYRRQYKTRSDDYGMAQHPAMLLHFTTAV